MACEGRIPVEQRTGTPTALGPARQPMDAFAEKMRQAEALLDAADAATGGEAPAKAINLPATAAIVFGSGSLGLGLRQNTEFGVSGDVSRLSPCCSASPQRAARSSGRDTYLACAQVSCEYGSCVERLNRLPGG